MNETYKIFVNRVFLLKVEPSMKLKNIVFSIMPCLFLACDGDAHSPEVIAKSELVYISDGSIQCEPGKMSIHETAQILLDDGIDVLNSSCGFLTGVVVMTACGAGTTMINLHEIKSENVSDAEHLGFSAVATIDVESGLGYEVIKCPDEP